MMPAEIPAAPTLPSCPVGTLLALGPGTAIIAPARCKKWACPDCGKKNARKLAARIALTPARRFITLTTRYDPSGDPVAELDRMAAAWRTIWKRIARKETDRPHGYIKIVEVTKHGWPHLHIAAQCRFVPQHTLSRWWSELTGSPVVDIRIVRTQRGIARYLGKYLTKQHGCLPGRRRYAATWRWLPALPLPELEPGESTPQWLYNRSQPEALALSLAAQGWRPFGQVWLSPTQWALLKE